MFGDNPLRPRDHHHDPDRLQVQGRPFETIQGEGPFAGMPAVFIRLWGCHLHCWFCDTDFESDEQHSRIDELIRFCRASAAPLVVLTGGEPMRQNIINLCLGLLGNGKLVQIETAGSFSMPPNRGWHKVVTNPRFHIVVSPKTPIINPELIDYIGSYKYIISTSQGVAEDGLPFTNTQVRGGLPRKLARPPAGFPKYDVYLQPMDEYDEAKNAANAAMCRLTAVTYGYRVSTQLHKQWGLP